MINSTGVITSFAQYCRIQSQISHHKCFADIKHNKNEVKQQKRICKIFFFKY